MSGEDDIRKLLKMRTDLELRVEQLEEEIEDLRKAIVEIDKIIVKQGFKQPSSQAESKPEQKFEFNAETKLLETLTSSSLNEASVQAKDGTLLGRIKVSPDSITFIPKEGLSFAITTPPWQSFLIDRVLVNMRTTDEAKASNGELEVNKILEYSLELDGEIIKSLNVKNYGGERRLREIQSSLRWSLDKMYDKMRRSE